MIDERIQRSLEGGRSVLVGTVDSENVPACCRGIAIRSDDGMETVRVFLPIATSLEVMANLASTRRIAIAVAYPPDHSSVQIKGTTSNVRIASPDDLSFVRQRLSEFAESLDQIGLPREITNSMNHWPAYAIDVQVAEIFEQTPGPRAGATLPR